MALSVSPCGNRKTWDARVRVTGGHPDLLWGIGEAEALTREHVSVERIAVDREDQTVGYGQLLVLVEGHHTVVDAKSLHVKNPRDLVTVLAALQEHARDTHHAAVLRASPDTHATTELAAQLGEAGYRRRDRPRRGEAGPRHLVVRLGETEGELSKRLSSETLQRCRAGLRDSRVRVRRVNAADRDLSHVGLRTQHIRELLRAVGENSVFLVATERPEGGPETALGYLWFVHTGESAMIYRLGFTDRARQLGVDDALLLTGLVQLQQRQVHRVLAGDPDQPGQPMVLRELATEDMEVLGTWEYPLAGEFQLAGRAEKTRRRILGRRARRATPEQLLPDPATADLAPGPRPTAPVRGGDDAAAAPVAPVAPVVDADPDLARSRERATPSAAEAGSAADTREVTGHRPGKRAHRPLPVPGTTLPGTRRRGRKGAPGHDDRDGNAVAGAAASSSPDGADRAGGSSSTTLLRRVVAEGRAAVRNAARW